MSNGSAAVMRGSMPAFTQGFIDAEQLLRLAEPMKATGYGKYLIRQAGLQS
jgi:hypothetical protein